MDAATHTLPVGHVGLSVRDLDRSRDFYVRALGLKVVGQQEAQGTRFAFLGDGERVTLTLWEQAAERFGDPRGAGAGLQHLAFEVPTASELEDVRRRLEALGAGFAYEGVVPHAEGATSGGLYFTDPDGIRLEIYAPSGVHGHVPVTGAPTCGFF
ncbi:MAG TPA: VOC family protein [Gemmatimonadales bacterium]|nr:VOC family protein [Gemmatimonadales bacterium]